MLERGWLAAFALALAACSFNGGGVADDTGDDTDAAPGDSDGDGIVDEDDNCPDDENAGQEDEDGDLVGNVCDNCPHVDNADQTNDGEVTAGAARDGAGDACDPFPSAAGNDILYFDGFDDGGALDDWTSHIVGNWTIADGRLNQSNPSVTTWLYLRARQFADVVIDTDAVVQSFSSAGGGVGTLAAFSSAPNEGAGYNCLTSYQTGSPDSGVLFVVTLRGAAAPQVEGSLTLGTDLAPATYALRQSTVNGELGCSVSSSALTAPASAAGSNATYPSGFIGVRTNSAAVQFPFVIVFSVDR